MKAGLELWYLAVNGFLRRVRSSRSFCRETSTFSIFTESLSCPAGHLATWSQSAISSSLQSTTHQVYQEYFVLNVGILAPSDPNGVPIDGLLSRTDFYFQQGSKFVRVESLKNEEATGELWHFSECRACLTNDKASNYKNSHDLVKLADGKIYFMGRNDRVVKINGKLTDLSLIEKVGSRF